MTPQLEVATLMMNVMIQHEVNPDHEAVLEFMADGICDLSVEAKLHYAEYMLNRDTSDLFSIETRKEFVRILLTDVLEEL